MNASLKELTACTRLFEILQQEVPFLAKLCRLLLRALHLAAGFCVLKPRPCCCTLGTIYLKLCSDRLALRT